MKSFLRIQQNSDTDAMLTYSGIDRDTLAKNIHAYFLNNGYKLIDGSPGNGMYEHGNHTMRILFGAFVKYYKFGISLQQQPDGTFCAWFKRETSGMSGGLIGMQQVKTEFSKVTFGLQQF